jgi:enoyl-CoA hydratase/carnithine racemase
MRNLRIVSYRTGDERQSAWRGEATNFKPKRSIGAGPVEFLYTGRVMGGEKAERWGIFNKLCRAVALSGKASAIAYLQIDAGRLQAVQGNEPRTDDRLQGNHYTGSTETARGTTKVGFALLMHP